MSHDLVPAGLARAAAFERQAGQCLLCGSGMHPERFAGHHRAKRRDVGWCRCNIVGLHHDCHNVAPGSVHQEPARARELGLIVPSWADPRAVPVTLFGSLVLLGCDGGASTVG